MKNNILLFLIAFTACTNTSVIETKSFSAEPWILVEDESTGLSSYQTKGGKIIIPADTYAQCLTDTFHTKAIVMTKNDNKWVVINRSQKVQYEVFPFDNGPDYPSDGLFRIIQNGKIGYADQSDYKIVIEPQFDCAYPFENGKAKVSKNCNTTSDGDHQTWESNDWKFVDKNGLETVSTNETGLPKTKTIEDYGLHYQKHNDYVSLKKVVELMNLESDTSYVSAILGKPIDMGFDYRYLIDSIGPKGCSIGAVFHINETGKIDRKWILEICE